MMCGIAASLMYVDAMMMLGRIILYCFLVRSSSSFFFLGLEVICQFSVPLRVDYVSRNSLIAVMEVATLKRFKKVGR